MVDQDLATMYDQLLAYLTAKLEYYNDPATPDVEFNDSREIDLTSTIDIIQRQISKIPSTGEAYTIRGYRHIRSNDAEYNMRLMSRSDYWDDAALEEQDNFDKWTFNKEMLAIGMSGTGGLSNG